MCMLAAALITRSHARVPKAECLSNPTRGVCTMQSRSIPCWTGQNTELGNVPGSMPMYCSVPYMCYRYACHRCLSVVRSLALSENAPHRLRAIQAWRMNRSYMYSRYTTPLCPTMTRWPRIAERTPSASYQPSQHDQRTSVDRRCYLVVDGATRRQ
jgi:hypothetical protein